jgi:hypothetical protein
MDGAAGECNCDQYNISDYASDDMPKAEFEDFWNAVQTGDIPMYSEYEMEFMSCDTNGDGSLDAEELDAKVYAPMCADGEACPTENIGQYLLC